MLSCSLDQREGQYQNLKDFTEKVHQDIMDITSVVGWTVESIETDNDNRLVCPYDSSHRIGKDILDQHLEFCQWKQEGYNEFDVPLSESMLPSCSPFSIKLDASLQNKILQEAREKDPTMKVGLGERLVPRTSDRIFSDFTCDERKVLYEYVVSNTVKTDIGHDITDERSLKCQNKDKKLSFLELLVQERNLKRRRAKHRGVHTNKKSHTEILREVINQQMEFYANELTEIQPTCHETKTEDIVKTPSSNRYFDDSTQSASPSFNESPSRYRNLFLQNSQNYRKSSNSRNNHTYEHSNSKDRDKRSRDSTESWKTQKHRKRRRSHSKERNYDKKGEHWRTRHNYDRDNTKSRETEKLVDGTSYLKRSANRRRNDE
ncbi:U11/U12 small nuclear ribonucleoprotein 48 kDa protein-like [Colletes gigas]|uniref:U11/U12 small nuclear ribonucleoprotein 48 kDa protein-like n=1 Tax=Colletes gigas TaxID=935657 RepID=UPI001C9BAE5D|nr:U11/U12 small nuclear ribonucleoprotein 48 kDa protein-like [Colletes gigas]